MNISPTEKLSLDNYHNKANDYSYGSRRTVYKFFPNLSGIKGSKKKIDKVLSQSDIHTKFKKYKRPRSYIPVYVHRLREQFQCDVIHMLGKKKDNNQCKYILSVIDCWSKFAWAFPLENIKCLTIMKCFIKLFSDPKNIPEKITTDRGSGEF